MTAQPNTAWAVPSALRALLLGTGIAAAAVVGSLALGASPAHAEEQPSQGLGSLVTEVTDLTSSVTGDVGGLLDSSPLSAATAPVLDTVDHVVADTVEAVPIAGPIVTEVVGSTPTSSVLAPVTGLLDDTLGATGQVVAGAGGVVDGLPPVLGLPGDPAVDADLPDASPAGPVSPIVVERAMGDASAPLVGPARGSAPIEVGGSAFELAGAATPVAAVQHPAPVAPHGRDGGADDALATSTTGAAAGSGSPLASPADTAGTASPATPAPTAVSTPSDDDLPSSAIHDTDTSPD